MDMRVSLFLMVLLGSLSASTTHGQWELNALGSWDRTDLSGNTPEGGRYVANNGATVGLGGTYFFKNGAGVGLEFNYNWVNVKLQYLDTLSVSRPGTIFESFELDWRDSLGISYEAITIPLVFKFLSRNERFLFDGGFSASIPLNARIVERNLDLEDLQGRIADVYISFFMGIAYRIPAGRFRISPYIRYFQGLMNSIDDRDNPDSKVPRVKPSGSRLGLSLSYRFGPSRTKQSDP